MKTAIVGAGVIGLRKKFKSKNFVKKHFVDIVIVALSLAFSIWLMFSTFSYKDGSMLIDSKLWSDFASHIPLIRSFSLGDNFPPEFPLFPGEPIRYHFLFYAAVGLLEKIGVRIDIALNILSAVSFSFLLVMIYALAKLLFKSMKVGIISALLFLFNGSLAFVYFFQNYDFNFSNIFLKIITNKEFPAFAPYDNTLISGGFWNLNVFTNQRHFALPLALSLLIIYLIVKVELLKKPLPLKIALLLGIIMGIFIYLHGAVFIMTLSIIFVFFVLFPRQRKSLAFLALLTFFISIPRVVFLADLDSSTGMSINPGYLVANNLSLDTWLRFWILNLGVGVATIPLGFILAKNLNRKVFIAFFSLFIIGNLFQFSPDIATNHKFFNLWIIVANMFTAFLLVLWWKKSILLRPFIVMCFVLLTLSGIIDFFPIKNDYAIALADYKKIQDITWIIKNTPQDAVFLNTSYLYNPASLAGRKIFFGWPYFAWSAGYDTDTRGKAMERILGQKDVVTACKLLRQNNIDYLEVQSEIHDPNMPDISSIFREKFILEYINTINNYSIYNVRKTCKFAKST